MELHLPMLLLHHHNPYYYNSHLFNPINKHNMICSMYQLHNLANNYIPQFTATLNGKANNRSQYRSFLHLKSWKFYHHQHLLKLHCHWEATHGGWLLHFLYLSIAIFMAFLGDHYGFSPTTKATSIMYLLRCSLKFKTQVLQMKECSTRLIVSHQWI